MRENQKKPAFIFATVDKRFMGPLDPNMPDFQLHQMYSNIIAMYESYLGLSNEEEQDDFLR
jgi:hypothetical protein